MNQLDPAANLLAIRHITGMSQRYVAEQLEVQEKSVKLWERGVRPVPPEVTEWANAQLARFNDAVDDTVEQTLAMAGDLDEAPAIDVTYYRTQGQYDRLGRDEGEVEQVDAKARAIGQRLALEGFDVQYCFPPEDNIGADPR